MREEQHLDSWRKKDEGRGGPLPMGSYVGLEKLKRTLLRKCGFVYEKVVPRD